MNQERNCPILIVAFILAGYLGISGLAVEPETLAFNKLYDSHDWFGLREAVNGNKTQPLYVGASASAFNDQTRAQTILLSIIKSDPKSDDAYEAYEVLAHLYLRTAQYQHLTAIMEKRWAAFPSKQLSNERTAMLPYRDLPDQSLVHGGRSTFTHTGDIHIPLSIGNGTATYFFDTGASTSCMSSSEAKRLGLTVNKAGGTLATGTSVRAPFRTAVARDVSIGNMKFKNVTFAVFPDDQEPGSSLKPGAAWNHRIAASPGIRNAALVL